MSKPRRARRHSLDLAKKIAVIDFIEKRVDLFVNVCSARSSNRPDIVWQMDQVAVSFSISRSQA